MLTSNAGVQYDYRILEEFNKLKTNGTTNETFVNVIIDLNDPSQTDNLLSTFSNKELKDILVRSPSDGISVKTSEEGFYKLLQDERVGKVYYNLPISAFRERNQRLTVLLIGVLLLILIVIIYFLIRKSKIEK